MLRTILYNDDARTIRAQRVYRTIDDFDLDGEMKLWFEYPESTRFARYPYDVLYTPIWFGNEGVSGHLCLEANVSIAHEIEQLTAEVSLKGGASLGLLNVGGRPANVYDTRFSFSAVGFRSIVSIPVLDMFENLSLTAGAYESSTVHGRRVPFSFTLPTRTLAELRELTPSLKLISSDTETTLDILKSQSPTMLINVRYVLEAVLFKGDVQTQKIEQEVRVWVALDESQVPSPLPEISDQVTQHRRTSLIPLKKTRSIPFTSSRRKSIHEGGNHVIIEAEDPEPFCFSTHNDAAATKVKLTLTYGSTGLGADANEPPGSIQANVEWLMKSLSTIAVQLNNPGDSEPPSEDYFHLRTRHLPMKKLKMDWTRWARPDSEERIGNAWTATQDLWLTLSTTAGLTPTFRTSFISHSYSMWLQFSFGGKGLKAKSYKVELNIPVKIRYDVGLAPSYSFDAELPSYEVDEGRNTQQPGPGSEHPDPPPPHEDADPRLHLRSERVPRYTPNELAELVRNTGLSGVEDTDRLLAFGPS